MIGHDFSPLSPEILGIAGVIVFLLLMGVFYLRLRNRDWLEISSTSLREIPAYSNLQRSITRAIEAGKRIHLTIGSGGINGLRGGSGFVGLTILRKITRLTAQTDKPALTTSGEGTLTILSQDSSHHAYGLAQNSERYDPTLAQLSGATPFSYAVGSLPAIFDQEVSTTVLAGHFGSEAALIADASQNADYITISGTENLSGQAIMYVLSEDHLIGEELFVGGAYIQAGVMHLASLRAQDIFRWVIFVMIIIGAILKFAGLI